jgi:membrane-associated phospholipid phosphatase
VVLGIQLACPAFFNVVDVKTANLWKLQIALNTILFPTLVTFLLWRLGFADNMYLRTTKERYIPIIASNFFYFWSFYVLHKGDHVPDLLKLLLLSVFISSSLLLIATIFAKISMHATAWAVAVAFLVIWAYHYDCHNIVILITSLIIAIAVGFARLTHKDHTVAEVITGTIIGVVSVVGSAIAYL